MIIYEKDKDLLRAQKRALAAWINNTLGAMEVDSENFLESLCTGVTLCRLAKVIQKTVEESERRKFYEQSQTTLLKLKFWENAKRETFFARDNAEIFLRWCRAFGVRETTLFESDGLVLRTQLRNVILCLFEMAHIAARYGLLLPPPVPLYQRKEPITEMTLDSENDSLRSIPSPSLLCHRRHRTDSGCSTGSRSPSSYSSCSPTQTLTKSVLPVQAIRTKASPPKSTRRQVVVRCPSGTPLPTCKESSLRSPRTSSHLWRRSYPLVNSDLVHFELQQSPVGAHKRSLSATVEANSNKKLFQGKSLSLGKLSHLSILDKRVLEVSRSLRKDESKIHRISDGRYSFGNKIASLRIVRDNNVVVRLGGGWDTLEHFLSTANFDDRPVTIKHKVEAALLSEHPRCHRNTKNCFALH